MTAAPDDPMEARIDIGNDLVFALETLVENIMIPHTPTPAPALSLTISLITGIL